MGSCFSKSGKEPVGANARTTGNSRFTRSEQKLGGDNDAAENGNQIIDEKHVANIDKSAQTSNTRNQDKLLGGQNAEQNNPSSREAVAKAAELRYNKQREQLKESQNKLKTMSRKSKQEKGLQT